MLILREMLFGSLSLKLILFFVNVSSAKKIQLHLTPDMLSYDHVAEWVKLLKLI